MIIITGSAKIRPEHFEAALRLGVEHSARSRQVAVGVEPALGRRPPSASVVQHDDAPGVGLRATAHEVHPARHLGAVVVAAVPHQRVLAGGEHAVRQCADAAPRDVIDRHLHAAGLRDTEPDG